MLHYIAHNQLMTGSLKLKSKIGTVCARKNGSKNKIKKEAIWTA